MLHNYRNKREARGIIPNAIPSNCSLQFLMPFWTMNRLEGGGEMHNRDSLHMKDFMLFCSSNVSPLTASAESKALLAAFQGAVNQADPLGGKLNKWFWVPFFLIAPLASLTKSTGSRPPNVHDTWVEQEEEMGHVYPLTYDEMYQHRNLLPFLFVWQQTGKSLAKKTVYTSSEFLSTNVDPYTTKMAPFTHKKGDAE